MKPGFHQCAGNDPNHVIQERVTADGQDPFVAADRQISGMQGADCGFRRAAGSLEGGKVMFSGECFQGLAYRGLVQRDGDMPVGIPPHGARSRSGRYRSCRK